MKKIFAITLVIVLVGGGAFLLFYLYKQNQKPPKEWKIANAEKRNIIKKTVATGSIVPEKEVSVKPQISGILDKIYVNPGETVKTGQLIAKIKVIPNMNALNDAESSVRRATISLKNAKKEYDRQKPLFDKSVISAQAFQQVSLDYDLAKENLKAAKENLKIIKEGAASNAGSSTTLVRATVDGMVLDIPMKEGSTVIESNTFNEGSTIAIIADMGKMIFEGKVDESEVGKLKKGMALKLNVGAVDSTSFDANLDYIAPKGVEEEGAIKFEIKAFVDLKKNFFLRAGYSANADIVLEKKDSVLAIEEKNIIFSGDTTFVEIKVAEQKFEKKEIKTGLSDGIYTEVLSGIDKEDKIKVL